MVFVGPSTLAGQLAALLGGALLAPLAYALSRDLWRDEETAVQEHQNSMAMQIHRAGLLAGLTIAVAGQPILSSVVVMSDSAALFWATLAAWCVVRAMNQPDPQRSGAAARSSAWFLAAGAAMGLAIITRWIYLLVVPALGFYAIFKMIRNRQPWWQPTPAILSGAVVLLPQLWISLNKPEGLIHQYLLGWQPGNFFQHGFDTADGLATYPLPMAVYYAQPAGHPAYIFPVLGLAALWAIWRLWRTRQWGPLILLLGWAAPAYVFLAGITFQNFRFGLILYLPLVILTGLGLSDIWEQFERRRSTTRSANLYSIPALRAIIALCLLGMLIWAYFMLDTFLTTQNQSKIIARQIEQILPPQATLLTFGLTLTLQHYTGLNTLEFFYLDEPALKALTEAHHSFYLLLDLQSVETQWQGRSPQRNYRWLQENTKLVETGVFSPYVLFEVDVPPGP
jgi:4-amino-4-deoxy-L-arabinose transferase-like glycosyltransferase